MCTCKRSGDGNTSTETTTITNTSGTLAIMRVAEIESQNEAQKVILYL